MTVTARVRDKPDMHSPYRKFHGRAPFARLLPFLKPGFHHVKRTLKSEPKAEACFYLNGGNNHAQDSCKILLISGRTSYSRDVTWEYPRKPFIGLVPAEEESPSPQLAPPHRRRQRHRPRVRRSLWSAPAYGTKRRRLRHRRRRRHGTCPPVGMGPESSQMYLPAVASQRYWGPASAVPPLPPPC